MFGFFGKRNGKARETTLRQFEVWRKTKTVGLFIVQERAECIDTILAESQEDANRQAALMGGYAVAPINHQG